MRIRSILLLINLKKCFLLSPKNDSTQRHEDAKEGRSEGCPFFFVNHSFSLKIFSYLKKNCILLEENSKLKKRMPGFTTHLKNLFDIHAYVNYLYFHQAKRLENKS